MKIKYIAYMASSIDGRIAQSNQSGIDWTSKEDSNFYQNSLKKVDAVIVGHNTYKLASRRNWKDAIVLTSKVSSPKVKGKTIFLDMVNHWKIRIEQYTNACLTKKYPLAPRVFCKH